MLSRLLAPALCVVLLGWSVYHLGSPIASQQVRQYMARVQTMNELVPLEPGAWHGKEAPLPPNIVQGLRPNAVLSRSYVNSSTGHAASVYLIHAADARDIACHYPPICYPSSGHDFMSGQDLDQTISGVAIHGAVYEFRRRTQTGATHLFVHNFMVLPGTGTDRDIAVVDRVAASRARRGWGAGQCQIIIDASIPPPQRQQIFEDMIRILKPAIQAILDTGETPATPAPAGVPTPAH